MKKGLVSSKKYVNNQISVSINMLGAWFVIVARGNNDLGWNVFLAIESGNSPVALWTSDLSKAAAFGGKGAAWNFATKEGLQVME